MAELSRLSDDELIARSSTDPEAFGVFYERHVTFVAGVLRHGTGSTELALDLTAESFAAALAASGRYRPGEAPARAWLLGIARNKLRGAQRSRGCERAARRRLGVPRLEFCDEALERTEELLDAAGSGYANALPIFSTHKARGPACHHAKVKVAGEAQAAREHAQNSGAALH